MPLTKLRLVVGGEDEALPITIAGVEGLAGWGQPGRLSLDAVDALRRKYVKDDRASAAPAIGSSSTAPAAAAAVCDSGCSPPVT